MKRPHSFLILSLVISGCSVGVKVDDFKPAQYPRGVQMEAKLHGNVVDGNKVAGELLAVRADGIIVNVSPLSDQGARVMLLPFWMMESVSLEQMGSARVRSQGKEMDEVYLNRLRLVSRFPQGLSDELLADLLVMTGQPELEIPEANR